jgi:hypothetical protein
MLLIEQSQSATAQTNQFSATTQLIVVICAILTALVPIIIALITRTIPWLKERIDSRSLRKSKAASLFPLDNIERSITYYVPPTCQDLDPAGGEEPKLVYAVKQNLFDALDDALSYPTDYRHFFLLADSGMGKTSALINYYARHLRSWTNKYKLALVPLGLPGVDERIIQIENKFETVILLDAFDEDTLAIADHVQRLRDLLKLTHDFRRVLISCRTQFFARDEEIPKETGILKVGSRAAGEPAEYVFKKIYISPFSDRQVKSYLRRRFPFWRFRRRRIAKQMIDKIPYLAVRPMLLAHVEDLVTGHRKFEFSFELYETMIEAWLLREKGFIKEIDNLRQFSELLAVDLYVNRENRGAERISKAELSTLAQEWSIPLDEWKLTGRSLLNRDAAGNFKFAHRSIMEYLFIKRFMSGDIRSLRVNWTDQMETFFWEMFQKDLTSKGKTSFERLLPFEGSALTAEGRLEVISHVAGHQRELHSSRFLKFTKEQDNASVGRLKVALILFSWLIDPERRGSAYTTVFNVTKANMMREIGRRRTYMITVHAQLSFRQFFDEENIPFVGIPITVSNSAHDSEIEYGLDGNEIWSCCIADYTAVSEILEGIKEYPAHLGFLISHRTRPVLFIIVAAEHSDLIQDHKLLVRALLRLFQG